MNEDYTLFDYLDYANIVQTREGDYYIAVKFTNYICFINKDFSLGTDKDYDENLKFIHDNEDLDIVALYRCELDTDLTIFEVLDRPDDWELIWKENNN